MYVKRYVVARGKKSYVYLRLVESFRDDEGRVRHRVLRTLGREDELKASGQLNQLAGIFARLDPPMAGVRRDVGPLLLVRHYLDRLGVAQVVDRQVPQRGRAELRTGEVIAALIANRLCAPSPLYDIAGWGSSAALQEVLDVPGMLLNDDRLGRALDAFAPVAESVRGALALAAIERFGADAARLHLDLTTLRVSGAYEKSSLVAMGWGSDRRVARQVRLLQATNREGVPLYVRPHPGDAAELVCIGAALESLTKLLKPGFVVCADSAFGHFRNLCDADRLGLRFVVPLRATSGFEARFLEEVGRRGLRPIRYHSQREARLPLRKRSRYRGAIRDWTVTDPVTAESRLFRVAYVWSSEEAKSVREARARALLKAEEALAKVRRGLNRRYYKKLEQVTAQIGRILVPPIRDLLEVKPGVRDGRLTLRWKRRRVAVARAAATDGVYALATNLPGRISATKILRIYKDQPIVEQRHRDAKSSLRIRPVFLHNDDRIAALLSVVGIALLIFGLLEADVRHALGPDIPLDDILPEGRAAKPTGRTILAAFQGLGLTYTQSGIALDPLTATQRRILQLLEIEIPWAQRAA